MRLPELFDILRGYQGTSLTLWNVYIGVVLGLLGYAITGKHALRFSVRLLLALGFVLFVWGNLTFLERTQRMVHAVSVEIGAVAQESRIESDALRDELETLHKRQPSSVAKLHLAVDAIVIALIFMAPPLISRYENAPARA